MNRDTETVTERAPSLDRGGRAAYRVVTDETEPSTAIVRAIVEVEDGGSLTEGERLYDVVDPDALDRLFEDRRDGGRRATGRAVFELRNCRVEVRADGNHVVYEPADGQSDRSLRNVQSA